MTDTVAWPALAMPRRSLLAALLAATMVATTLVVTPVPLPLMGGVNEASAHDQTRCFQETVRVPVYGNPYSHVPTSYDTRTQTRCVDVAHSHPEDVAATAVVVVATCGVASLYGPWAGVGCGVAFGTLAVVEATSSK